MRLGVALALGLSFVLGLSACAPLNTPIPMTTPAAESGNLADDTMLATIRVGLKNISKRYIDPIDMPTVAISGMRGLTIIAPGLRITRSDDGHSIHLVLNGTPLKRFPLPHRDDASTWAHLATAVIRTARAHSPNLKSADNERILEAVFDGMMANLDIFSRYAGAEEARANRARRDGFGGIGIHFTKAPDGILITHVKREGPAKIGGIKPGDLIIKIDDKNVRHRSQRNVAKLLRGPVGSLITIAVERLSSRQDTAERRIYFSLQRAYIIPETVIAQIKGDVLWLRISSFNKGTAPRTHDVLETFATDIVSGAIHGIVMDLRGNPGGLLSQSIHVADMFVDAGPIISTRGRHRDSIHNYRASTGDLAQGLPLVILIDGNSASAAEIVASALQDLGRAVLVGSTSYGKGTVQTVVRLPNDGEMTLTWSRLVSPSGYALHGLGVMPTVCATSAQRRPGHTESVVDSILAPSHIDRQRQKIAAWRAAGLIFDGRRAPLRQACPTRTFKAGNDGDLLMKLAGRVIDDPALYQRALVHLPPVSTASRQ